MSRMWSVLLVAIFLSCALVLPGPSTPVYAQPHAHHTGNSLAISSALKWENYDRAIYVLSTLNLPLCGSGRPLGGVLQRDGATFMVYRSTRDDSLYFIRVGVGDHSAVYAYRMGWALPRGVVSARCVDPAGPDIAATYRSGELTKLGTFSSTLPG
jgi:hypothetical protein